LSSRSTLTPAIKAASPSSIAVARCLASITTSLFLKLEIFASARLLRFNGLGLLYSFSWNESSWSGSSLAPSKSRASPSTITMAGTVTLVTTSAFVEVKVFRSTIFLHTNFLTTQVFGASSRVQLFRLDTFATRFRCHTLSYRTVRLGNSISSSTNTEAQAIASSLSITHTVVLSTKYVRVQITLSIQFSENVI
jgi:hypothetical protein